MRKTKIDNFETVLNKTERLIEAEKMLKDGVPISVIARTLDLKLSEIIRH
ncbi:hypothetical protein [Facilibium subflavum]|nr:hypothetical protein [Facilibium subflavum]